MNYLDSTYELSDYQEDYLAVTEHSLDIEPDWYLELDIEAMAL